MYFYESHLGGIYTSDEDLNYEELYCEQCGDSDRPIGYFTQNEAEKFWQEYKPYNLTCIGCRKTTEECDKCHDDEGDGSYYSLREIMSVICENFTCPNKTEVYVIVHNKHNDSYYLGCEYYDDKKTGITTAHHIPYHCPCFKDELTDKVAVEITPYFDCNIERRALPKLNFSCKINDVRNVVYLIDGDFGETDVDRIGYTGEMWAGWIPEKDVNFEGQYSFLSGCISGKPETSEKPLNNVQP